MARVALILALVAWLTPLPGRATNPVLDSGIWPTAPDNLVLLGRLEKCSKPVSSTVKRLMDDPMMASLGKVDHAVVRISCTLRLTEDLHRAQGAPRKPGSTVAMVLEQTRPLVRGTTPKTPEQRQATFEDLTDIVKDQATDGAKDDAIFELEAKTMRCVRRVPKARLLEIRMSLHGPPHSH